MSVEENIVVQTDDFQALNTEDKELDEKDNNNKKMAWLERITMDYKNNYINLKIIFLMTILTVLIISFSLHINNKNNLVNKPDINDEPKLTLKDKNNNKKGLEEKNRTKEEDKKKKEEEDKKKKEEEKKRKEEEDKKKKEEEDKKKKEEEKQKNEKLVIPEDNRNIVWQKGLDFTRQCVEGKLLKQIPNYPDDHIPAISIIIPVYNAQKSIKLAIRSIQNQLMTDLEIILVNDCSTDNSTKIIYELQKEDKRIKLMNNTKNMGTLYSRCVGVLAAKADYMFALDNDDMFFVNDILNVAYKLAIQDDIDIVAFKSVKARKYNLQVKELEDWGFYYYNHRHNLVLHQPELGLFPISRYGRFERNDFNLWNKCYKSEVYKTAVNRMGKERYSKWMSWAEDTCMTFVIYNTAKSFKYVRKWGIFHLEMPLCASQSQPNDKKTFGEIFLMDTVYEFSKNTSDKNYAAYQALDSLSRSFFNVEKNKVNSDFLKSVLKKIYENKLISEANKNKVRNKFSSLKFYD